MRLVIPYDVLALTYLKAVEEGRMPGQALRDLGLNRNAAAYRRSWMGVTRWLPRGDPVTDGRLQGVYGAEWQAQARQMIAAKLRQSRERAEAREAPKIREEQELKIRREFCEGLSRAREAQRAQVRMETPRHEDRAVLDAFV